MWHHRESLYIHNASVCRPLSAEALSNLFSFFLPLLLRLSTVSSAVHASSDFGSLYDHIYNCNCNCNYNCCYATYTCTPAPTLQILPSPAQLTPSPPRRRVSRREALLGPLSPPPRPSTGSPVGQKTLNSSCKLPITRFSPVTPCTCSQSITPRDCFSLATSSSRHRDSR